MTMPAELTTGHSEAVLDEIERVVVGKRAALTLILTAVLAGGHVLIEDLPGLGKQEQQKKLQKKLKQKHFLPSSTQRQVFQILFLVFAQN